MKKKITSFFAMALLFAGAANAQFEELGDKTVGVCEEVLTMDQIVPETQWYAVYQARPYGGYTGGYWWDKGAGETLYKSAGTEMLQMTSGADAAPYVVRFLTTETEGVYNVQFATGNYFASDVTSTADVANAAQIRMYNIVTEETPNPGHWAFNLVNNEDKILDNNGSGNTLSPWGTGDVKSLNGNNDHKIYVVRELSESEILTAKTTAILAEIEPKIELAKTKEFKLGDAQITNVGQFSSPYTEPSEGSIDALIDGDASSFWHSNWSDGNAPNGTHYLQVELAQSLEAAAFTFTRRNAGSDHIIQWGVYGTNDSEAAKDACTLLATIDTPYGSNTETLTSSAFAVGKYKYLRFYAEATTSNRGFFHLAEFQLYEASILPETMADKMGAVFTNLEAAVDAAKAEDPITAETYAALESAYEVFCKVLELPFFGGNYYLKNVESGKYLGAANSWGTQASLVEHGEHVTLALLPDGAFSLESRVNNGGTQYYLGANGFMDNGEAMPLTFVANGEYFTIKGGESFIGYDGTSTVLALNLAADAPGALWQVISEADMLASLATATAEAPVDATFLIKDHSFSRNHRDKGAWVVSEDCTNKSLAGGDNTNMCAESYHSVFNIGQTLKVPNGVYALTAQGFYRQDGTDNENLPVFYANDATAQFPLLTGTENSMAEASASFSTGAYTIEPITVEVTNGILNVGVKLENNANLWCIWDHFVLTCVTRYEIIAADPENGATIEGKLAPITLSFPDYDVIAVNPENDTPFSVSENGGEMMTVKMGVFVDENTKDNKAVMGINYFGTLSPIATAPGTYVIDVPAGKFLLGAEKVASKKFSLTYTVEPYKPVAAVTETKLDADGNVDIIFSEYGAAIVNYECTESILVKAGEEVIATLSAADVDAGAEWNELIVKTGLTKAGSYTVEIPEAIFLLAVGQYEEPLIPNAAFTVEVKIAGPDVVVTDPANGSTVKGQLDPILLVYKEYDVIAVNPENTEMVTVSVNGAEPVIFKNTVFFDEKEDNSIVFGANMYAKDPLATEPGTYTIVIPAGQFLLGADKTLSQELTLTYIVEAPELVKPECEASMMEDGNIKLLFPDVFMVTYDYSFEGKLVIKSGDEVVMELGIDKLSFPAEMNAIVIEAGLTEPGTYTIEVPAGMFVIVKENSTPSVTADAFTVTVSVADGIDSIKVNGEDKAYNLSGNRVQKGYKGVVIINGKRYIRK